VATIPAATLASLKQLSARRSVTPFMMLLACAKLLLARYTGQQDIAIGAPIANRTRFATEHLIGTLVNTLVMRTNLEGDPTFGELLNRVRDTALEAYAHQDLPFERLVEEFSGNRDGAYSPLVQVLFNVPNAPMGEVLFDDLEWDVFDFDHGSAQFDLSLSVGTEHFGRVYLRYSTDLFESATAQRMLAHYLGLIEQVVADPDKPISSYGVLTDAERRLIIHDWNRTAAPYPADNRADELIEAQAQRAPDAVAVSMGADRLTYAKLDARANQLAHFLRRRGVERGSLVGICVERSPLMVVAVLAVMKAGATYVPLDPTFPGNRLRMMALDAGLALILSQRHILRALPDFPGERICLTDAAREIGAQPLNTVAIRSMPEDLAYVLYTSGSSGKPKGVEIPHRALTNFLWSMRTAPGCSEGDTLLAVTTLSFDISGLELLLPLIVGGRIELASRGEVSDARLLRERIEACHPTIMQATPATWRMLLDAGWGGSPTLKILCGGEALQRDLADALLARCAALWNMYGPTETTIWSTLERIEPAGEISIGRPIANTVVHILDAHLEPVPIGVAGELYIGGDGVARGYRHLTELTAERFLPNPFVGTASGKLYRTGDVARYLADGRIVHLGRSDFQVKIRGFRVEPDEVEAALARHPAVSQVVVAARNDRTDVKQLVAYLVPRRGLRPSTEELRAFLSRDLPAYMVPSSFVFLEQLPLTANNKIDVKALPDPATMPVTPAGPEAEPRGQFEVQLTALWQQVLGRGLIGVHENFFDIGGHSLKAVQLFAYLEQVLGRQLPLATLFEAPTIAQLARLLTESGWEPSTSSLVAIQPAGSAAPVFAVPGVGGNVLVYAPLAKLLGNDQPFYGLQARGLYGLAKPFRSVVEAATHYVRDIRSVRPAGPYIIAGACTGGLFAYEIAQQLTSAGERVVLVIIESWHPSAYRRRKMTLRVPLPIVYLWSKLVSFGAALAARPLREWPALFGNKALRIGALLSTDREETFASQDFHSQMVVEATLQAVATYETRPYRGGLLNLVAGGRKLAVGLIDTRRVWEQFARGPNATVVTAAEDSGRMFVSPHIEQTAALIAQYVAKEFAHAEAVTAQTPGIAADARAAARS
jgi:amino acid adenylation domain-containing protein